MSATTILSRPRMCVNGTSHLADSSSSSRDQQYSMHIEISPFSRILPGSSICPPLVIKVEGPSRYSSLGSVWAYASLTTETGAAIPASQNGILKGRCCDSLQLTNNESVGYAVFNDLSLTRPGRYRIRISLIEMNRPGQVGGGRNVQQTFSDVITVDPSAEIPRICEFSRLVFQAHTYRHTSCECICDFE